MSTLETRRVIEGYLGDGDSTWLSELVELFEPVTRQPHRGRRQVNEWSARWRHGAFSQVHVDPLALLIDDGHAAYEFSFRAVHSGSFDGEPPTGMQLRIPMVATYRVQGGEITVARLYYDAGGLRQMLSAGAVEHAVPPPPS